MLEVAQYQFLKIIEISSVLRNLISRLINRLRLISCFCKKLQINILRACFDKTIQNKPLKLSNGIYKHNIVYANQ